MSLALGVLSHIPASLTVACQLFTASPPAVGWHPHFGEENYVFLQNSRQIRLQSNDLAYCGEFSNIDSDRVWAAWTAPPPELPTPPARVEYPEEGIIAIGDRPSSGENVSASSAIIAANEAFEELARFSRENQNSAVMPEQVAWHTWRISYFQSAYVISAAGGVPAGHVIATPIALAQVPLPRPRPESARIASYDVKQLVEARQLIDQQLDRYEAGLIHGLVEAEDAAGAAINAAVAIW